MHRNPTRIARRALVLALLVPAAARATPWNTPEHHGGHQHTEGFGQGPLYNDAEATISPRDASLIQDYYRAQPGTPPPPGQPHPWASGQKLPVGVPTEPLPPELNARVSPFYGFHYVRLGGDVLLVADGTGIVAAGIPALIR